MSELRAIVSSSDELGRQRSLLPKGSHKAVARSVNYQPVTIRSSVSNTDFWAGANALPPDVRTVHTVEMEVGALGSLLDQLHQLNKRVATLEASVLEYDLREVTVMQAKKEIAAFFEKNHGETIFPSDVANALRIDYDLVLKVVEELEEEGEVAEAAKA